MGIKIRRNGQIRPGSAGTGEEYYPHGGVLKDKMPVKSE
jgi:hypothetical protein